MDDPKCRVTWKMGALRGEGSLSIAELYLAIKNVEKYG